MAALCQTFFACDHWSFGSTQVLLRLTSCSHSKYAASDVSTCVQICSCIRDAPNRNPSSYIGSLARAILCTWATIVASSSSSAKALNVTQPDSGWPCGVISVNDSSSAYSTITPVPTDRPCSEALISTTSPGATPATEG